MRRTVRIFLNAGAALSAVLCLAAAVLWVHGYRSPHHYQRRQWWADGYRYSIFQWYTSGRGFLIVWSSETEVDPPASERPAFNQPVESQWVPQPRTDDWPGAPELPWWMRLGFDWRNTRSEEEHLSLERVPYVERSHMRIIAAPYWAIVIPTAVLPLLAVVGIRRRRRWRARMARGQCPACGYDLRATPGRCPECGRAASPTASAASDG